MIETQNLDLKGDIPPAGNVERGFTEPQRSLPLKRAYGVLTSEALLLCYAGRKYSKIPQVCWLDD